MTTPVDALEPYFAEAITLFERAVARAGPGPDRHLQIAGHSIHLRFAGPALGPKLLPALQHLPDAGASASRFTICLWDAESTDTPLPPPPWDELDYYERSNMRGFDDGRFTLNFERRTDVFSAVDKGRDIAIYWTRDASLLPHYEIGSPLRRVLQGWFRGTGLILTHAAAIGRLDAGMLLAGRGGSGKSTTAILALGSDLMFVGDDMTLVQAEPAPYVHSLYSSAKIDRTMLDRIPEVRPAVGNAGRLDDKAMLFLANGFRHKVSLGFPLRAIAVPRLSGRPETVVSRTSPLAAFRAIAPDTILTTLGDGRGVLQVMNSLVRQLPCYDLSLGSDLEGVRRALPRVLED